MLEELTTSPAEYMRGPSISFLTYLRKKHRVIFYDITEAQEDLLPPIYRSLNPF